MSPELVQNTPYNSAADVWAYGVIAHQLLGGYMPFSNRASSARDFAEASRFTVSYKGSGVRWQRRVATGEFHDNETVTGMITSGLPAQHFDTETTPRWAAVSPSAIDLLKTVLDTNSHFKKRPSMQQLLEHPWLNNSSTNATTLAKPLPEEVAYDFWLQRSIKGQINVTPIAVLSPVKARRLDAKARYGEEMNYPVSPEKPVQYTHLHGKVTSLLNRF